MPSLEGWFGKMWKGGVSIKFSNLNNLNNFKNIKNIVYFDVHKHCILEKFQEHKFETRFENFLGNFFKGNLEVIYFILLGN
jgi:hypothetical protein